MGICASHGTFIVKISVYELDMLKSQILNLWYDMCLSEAISLRCNKYLL